MRKLLLAVLLLASTSAIACETRTYIIDGKITICTICPTTTTCYQENIMTEFIWFVMGFCCGVCTSIGVTVYLGQREIAKRRNRVTNWQKIKKDVDKNFHDEYGV